MVGRPGVRMRRVAPHRWEPPRRAEQALPKAPRQARFSLEALRFLSERFPRQSDAKLQAFNKAHAICNVGKKIKTPFVRNFFPIFPRIRSVMPV